MAPQQPQQQGSGPRITASGEIIWPGRSPTTQHQSVSIPPSSGASAGAGGAGSQRATTTTSSSTFFSRCVNACRGPICGFPQSSVQYPTSGEPPFIWLPPFLGLAPIFWFLILGALTSGLIAHFLASTVSTTVMVIFLCLLGLSLHEFSHAFVAFKAGATNVSESGYLTCDLLRYLEIFDIFFCVLFVPTGGMLIPGGRVRIDESSVRTRGWKSMIALAGPLTNLLLVLLSALIIQIYLLTNVTNLDRKLDLPIVGLICFVFLEVMSVVLNLLPLPPLDGWNALEAFLPDNCFLKSFLRGDYLRERICSYICTIILYFLIARVEGVWRSFLFISAALTGLPVSLFGDSLHVMLHPLSSSSSLRFQDFMKP